MYWLYLIVFILAVLTPDIIRHDLYFLGEERAEEVMIFILLTAAFILYLVKERQFFSVSKEKTEIQKEAHYMTRDLTNSYLYIGEANRKLEILKHIALGIQESPVNGSIRKRAEYDTILEAIHILGKSNNFIVRFVNLEDKTTAKEIKSKQKLIFAIDNKEIAKKDNSYFETKSYFVFVSPAHNKFSISAIIIAKRNRQHKIEDPEMMKAITAQALCIFCNGERTIRNS